MEILRNTLEISLLVFVLLNAIFTIYIIKTDTDSTSKRSTRVIGILFVVCYFTLLFGTVIYVLLQWTIF